MSVATSTTQRVVVHSPMHVHSERQESMYSLGNQGEMKGGKTSRRLQAMPAFGENWEQFRSVSRLQVVNAVPMY